MPYEFNIWIGSSLIWSLPWQSLKSWVSGPLGGSAYSQSALCHQTHSTCSLPYIWPFLWSLKIIRLLLTSGILKTSFSLPEVYPLTLFSLINSYSCFISGIKCCFPKKSSLTSAKFSHYTLSDSTCLSHLLFYKMVEFFSFRPFLEILTQERGSRPLFPSPHEPLERILHNW